MSRKLGNLIKLTIFVFIFLYLLVHVSYMCRGELAVTRANLSGFYNEEKNSLDVVIIGTSGTFSAYAPMEAYKEHGYTSYNFCANLMGADNMVYAVDEVLKYQSPKVLVIDIMPYVVGNIAREYTEDYAIRYNTDGYRYSLNRLRAIRNIVGSGGLSYYFDIIKYHENEFYWDNFFCSLDNVNKGFYLLGYGVVESAYSSDKKVQIDENANQCLTEMIEKCKEVEATTDTEVLFIYYPYGDVSDRCENPTEKINYIQDTVSKAGFTMWNSLDFIDEFEMDTSKDYWDCAHFNIYGAEKISKIFGNYLANTYNFTDKRADEQYEKWNEDIQSWENLKKSYKTQIDGIIAEYNKNQ